MVKSLAKVTQLERGSHDFKIGRSLESLLSSVP